MHLRLWGLESLGSREGKPGVKQVSLKRIRTPVARATSAGLWSNITSEAVELGNGEGSLLGLSRCLLIFLPGLRLGGCPVCLWLFRLFGG